MARLWSTSLGAFNADRHFEIDIIAQALVQQYNTIRMNLVTISMMPGVRQVDRHAENLSADDRRVTDVIYAQLHNSISLSEIYIVPSDFDPHKVDAKTGKPQKPIFMFDGKNLGAGDFVIADVQAAEEVKPKNMVC